MGGSEAGRPQDDPDPRRPVLAENRWTTDPSFRDHRLVSTQFDIEQPVVDAGGWRVLAPFKFREYRLLITAVSLSIFAEGMWAVVMALQVIELDNDPASLSLVATCLGVGLVAFLLVGGIAADRINQRAIIIAAQGVNVIAVSAVAVLGLVGALHIWHMAVAAATLGVAAAFFFPAYSAILPRILPAEHCWPPTVSKA